ncbi:cryptochrome/photolyase family protein [Massilia sp. B-10]|nr:cryptochrome/photolyase family protein [Massilia sp. B-10]
MEYFYRQMRLVHKVLVEQDGKPWQPVELRPRQPQAMARHAARAVRYARPA